MVESGFSKWLLLVSDQQGSAAIPFDHIISATPKELMKARGAGGVYDTVMHQPAAPHDRINVLLALHTYCGRKTE